MPPQAATLDDEYGLESAKPAGGVTDDKYGLEPANKPAMASGSFQQRKGGPVLNANTTGIQGQSKKEVTENLKSDAAAGSRLGPGTTPGRLVDEATLGAASGYSGMPESTHPLQDVIDQTKREGNEIMQHPIKTIAKKALLGPAPQLYDIGKGLVESGGEIGSGIVHLDPEKVAHGGGSLIGKLAALGTLEEAPKTVGQPSTVGTKMAEIARDPHTGELKPGAVTTGKVGGGLIGAVAGGAGGEALLGGHNIGGGVYGAVQGARAGAALGPTVVEKMIPPRPIYPGASLPDAGEFYENRGTDLTKRGKEQGRIDTANEAKLKETEDARQKGLADRGKLEMQDATEQAAALRRQQALDAKEKAANASKIIQPGGGVQTGPNIESEGRPATWTNESIGTSARTGNRPAITQKILRNIPLGENERYVMGDPNYSNLVTSPREVTKFGPTGEPIRLEAGRPMGKNLDPLAAASRSRRPLMLGKPPEAPGTPQIPQLNFEQPIQVPSEGPVKPMQRPGTIIPPESSAVSPLPNPPPSPRWISDRGAMPGEPSMFLDGDAQTAKAAITEVEDPHSPGRATFEVHLPNGDLLGGFGTAEEAAKHAEANVPQDVPRGTSEVKPMQKPTETGPAPRRAIPGETPERRQATRDIVHDMSIEQLEGELKKPGISGEDRARVQRNIDDLREMREEPQEVHIKGLTAAEPKGKATVKPMEKPVAIDKKYTPEQIADAEGLINQEIGMMQSADRPGRYFDESTEGEHALAGRGRQGIDRMGGSWRGVKSLRPGMPFMKENPQFTPAQLEKALRNKDSALYRKAMERAIDFNRRQKAGKGEAAELGEHVPGEEEFPPKE